MNKNAKKLTMLLGMPLGKKGSKSTPTSNMPIEKKSSKPVKKKTSKVVKNKTTKKGKKKGTKINNPFFGG